MTKLITPSSLTAVFWPAWVRISHPDKLRVGSPSSAVSTSLLPALHAGAGSCVLRNNGWHA
jgi:hypothetical protein